MHVPTTSFTVSLPTKLIIISLRLARNIVQAEVEEGLRTNDADFDKDFRYV